MLFDAKWISLVPIFLTAISVMLGLIAYLRQQRINRLQNLISVFQRFSNNDDFINLFSLCDSCYVKLNIPAQQPELSVTEGQLMTVTPEKKFKYLALLEEIAMLAKNSAVINDNALHLFKFHFYYVYGNHEISNAFWYNIGSGSDEKNKEGWSYQSDFAKKCKTEIEGNKGN